MKTPHPTHPMGSHLKLRALALPMLALASLACSSAIAQNLVSDPGFESGTPSTAYSAGSTALPGWTVDTTPSDGVQLYTASILGATQPGNTLVLQLTGGSTYAGGGGVQQTIATTSGVTYTVSIDVASRQGNSVTGNFSFGGQNQSISASSKTFTTLTWTVVASSASTLIDITGHTSSASGQLLIDNVFVTPPAVASATNSTVAAAPAAVPADGTSTSTITVTLRDAGNVPVVGKTVTLAHTAGPGTPTITTISGVTNGAGVATFTVASSTAGAATFTATDVTDANLPIIETATVTFAAPAPIVWGTAATIAGDTDVSTAGTLKYAYHWASGDQTVNGVTFTGTTSITAGGGDVGLAGFSAQYGAFTGTVAPFTDLSTEYKATLVGSPYNGGGTATVTLKNLTPGNQYAVQVWCQDARNEPNSRFATLASTGGNSVTLDYNSIGADGGVGQYGIGTFIASSSLQTFTIANNGSAQINALQVRDLGLPAPITWGAGTTIAGDTDVSTTGTLKYAYHWGAGDQSVNGVTFTGTTSFTSGGSDVWLSGFTANFPAFTSTSAPFTDLSPAYQAMLAGSNYNDAADVTVTLKNLTAGKPYAVQVWIQDPRSVNDRSATLTSLGGNSVILDYNSTGAGGVGQYSIGTFIADGAIQSFTIDVPGPGSSAQLNALQVRDLSAVDDYAAWSGPSGYNLANGPAGDDDNDGRSNQEEYAFGLIPNSGTSLNPISVQLNKAAKTFSYTRRDSSKTDLNYSVWFSTDLSGWTEDTGATEGTPVLNGEIETVEVTLSALPGDPLPDKLFIQVRAD